MFFRTKHKISGFTLVELLIVVSVIAILSTIVLYANISSAAQKARDSKRKQDLNKLVRSFEDYYNDHGVYPLANDPPDGKISGSPWGAPFGGVAELPRDPLSPNRDYYYQMGSAGKFFILYTRLENTSDPDIERVGCQNGCGPKTETGERAFNFFVASSDVIVAEGIPNGEDPGVLPGTPTPTPTIGGPTPTPNCPPGEPCCGNDQCCAVPYYCGSSQCPGDKNKCLFSVEQYRYLCSYQPDVCPE